MNRVDSRRRLWVQIMAVVRKEVRQTLRDRRMLFMLLVAPLFELVVLGYAVNLDVDQVPTVIVDQDGTARSRDDVRRLMADGTLDAVRYTGDATEAEAWLVRGDASVVVLVPQGYGRALARGDSAEVQVILDGSDPNRSNIAGVAASRYFQGVALEIAQARVARYGAAHGVAVHLPTIEANPRVFYNPSLDTAIFMVPGVAVLVLIIVTTIVTAMGLSREREVGTLEQIMVTPIPTGALMLGKVLPFVVVGLADVMTALTASAWLFDVPIRGGLVFLIFATGLYMLTTLGLGLFIATVSETQQQAFMGGVFFILPAILLSGTFTPVSSMPGWMQVLTWINPVRYYIEILRAILLKAATPADLWVQLVALGVYGVLIITLASLRFRKVAGT